MMMLAPRHERRSLALQLIERGLRTAPVKQLTDLQESEIRALYRAVHGSASPAGQLPTAARLFRSRRMQLQVSLFAALYRKLGGAKVYLTPDPMALIHSYDVFRELHLSHLHPGRGPLDFMGAWAIARDLSLGLVRLLPCHDCRIAFLVANHSDIPPTCPYCALRRARRQHRKRQSIRVGDAATPDP